MESMERKCKDRDCIHVVQAGDCLEAVVVNVMNIGVSYSAGNFLTTWMHD
jgi:hypothetical protein